MYCGNNSLHSSLVDGSQILGTRYGCLKKGIGKGMSLPVDSTYIGPYEPIDKTRVYCGNWNGLTRNYDRLGSLPECLQRGVGIGKRKVAMMQQGDGGVGTTIETYKYLCIIYFWVLSCIYVFMILYFYKPSILCEKNSKKIIWTRFIIFNVFLDILLGCVILMLGIYF